MALSKNRSSQQARKRLASAMSSTAAGNAAGLKQLYALTSRKLFGICLRISGDRTAAEDILQDVYVKIWRTAGLFDPQRASAVSWLAVIARNSSVDWLRANTRHRSGVVDDKVVLSLVDDDPLADLLVVREEERARLLACMEGLEDDQANAIRRSFLEGMTYQQIADDMDRPLGTLKSWVRRGLQKLKACLGDD